MVTSKQNTKTCDTLILYLNITLKCDLLSIASFILLCSRVNEKMISPSNIRLIIMITYIFSALIDVFALHFTGAVTCVMFIIWLHFPCVELSLLECVFVVSDIFVYEVESRICCLIERLEQIVNSNKLLQEIRKDLFDANNEIKRNFQFIKFLVNLGESSGKSKKRNQIFVQNVFSPCIQKNNFVKLKKLLWTILCEVFRDTKNLFDKFFGFSFDLLNMFGFSIEGLLLENGKLSSCVFNEIITSHKTRGF